MFFRHTFILVALFITGCSDQKSHDSGKLGIEQNTSLGEPTSPREHNHPRDIKNFEGRWSGELRNTKIDLIITRGKHNYIIESVGYSGNTINKFTADIEGENLKTKSGGLLFINSETGNLETDTGEIFVKVE